jgi:hypothetical protein
VIAHPKRRKPSYFEPGDRGAYYTSLGTVTKITPTWVWVRLDGAARAHKRFADELNLVERAADHDDERS